MFLERVLELDSDLTSRSVFLFGPRQTGKTTLLRHRYPNAYWINLLRGDDFLRFSIQPGRLREETAHLQAGDIVIIDEIQKLPTLLDDVHDRIEAQGLRFVLTGSSPVKLRRGGVNLLGGRARLRTLHPLVYPEMPHWQLERVCAVGAIPSVYQSDDAWEDLRSYVGGYLQHEVQAEGLSRGIAGFARFLHVAALCAGQQINFERAAVDAQVPARTIREYYHLLQETLLGRMLTPFQPHRAQSRKAVSHGKFYFFDVGVVQALCGRRQLALGTAEFGQALEQYLYTELAAWCSYRRIDGELQFWRTVDNREVDFVVPNRFAIEVKASHAVTTADLSGLKALTLDAPELKPMLVCLEPRPRIVDGIPVLPVAHFLERLWRDEL